jgi:hypothetical protein
MACSVSCWCPLKVRRTDAAPNARSLEMTEYDQDVVASLRDAPQPRPTMLQCRACRAIATYVVIEISPLFQATNPGPQACSSMNSARNAERLRAVAHFERREGVNVYLRLRLFGCATDVEDVGR